MSVLRDVLRRVRTAAPGRGLDDIARDLGISRDEVDAMVDYWVRRGELVVDELSSCASGSCGSCRLSGRGGDCYRPAPRSGPALVRIGPPPPDPVRTRAG
ncbi:MAG: FeoC-like transcriptional regulator [Micromonospora sp.]